MRPVSLSHSGATGPRPITQSELATALALASTPDSSAVTPTTSSQVRFILSGKRFKSDGKTLYITHIKNTISAIKFVCITADEYVYLLFLFSAILSSI